MCKLSLNLVLLMFVISAWGQKSPHGKNAQLNCLDCHSAESWNLTPTGKFNHSQTQFALEGQHRYANCRACHPSLVFSEAGGNCIDCHTDRHQNTVGTDCASCHNTNSWLVSNITELHQQSRFPLLGAHKTADCAACHTSASQLEFEPLGVECIDCHQPDYLATTNPNHVQAGMSTNCIECHRLEAYEWASAGINHDFFPLTKGHKINDCATCHTSGITVPPSPDCYSCHQNDYASAVNPLHQASGFSTICTDCHTTNPGWEPATFKSHDANYFPIYSGNHNGEWNSCNDCHTQPGNFSVFSCTDCHEHNRSDMDEEHRGITGYGYNSLSCLACHPTGDKEGSFDHDNSYFPIYSGKHREAWSSCTECHTEPSTFMVFSCTSCHEHNQSEMDEKHSEVADYIYSSQSCLACHPTGNSDDD